MDTRSETLLQVDGNLIYLTSDLMVNLHEYTDSNCCISLNKPRTKNQSGQAYTFNVQNKKHKSEQVREWKS